LFDESKNKKLAMFDDKKNSQQIMEENVGYSIYKLKSKMPGLEYSDSLKQVRANEKDPRKEAKIRQ